MEKAAIANPPKPGFGGIFSNTLALSLLASLLLFLLAFAYISLGQKPSVSIYYSEGPLKKNSALGLRAGNVLLYNLTAASGLRGSVRYDISSYPGCPISITENLAASYCIGGKGELLGGKNGMQPNSTLGFFAPWMLAIGPGWRWEANVTTDYSGMVSTATDMLFEDIGGEEALGRDARKIRILVRENGRNDTIYYWVDSGKRVLVKALMPDGSSVELAEYSE